MPAAPADGDATEEMPADRPDAGDVFRRSLIKGVAVLLPLVVTLFVVAFVLGFVFQQIRPLVTAVAGTGVVDSEMIVTAITLVVFFCLVLLIGFTAEFAPGGHRLNDEFDEFMSSVPGVGSVYTSFNEMTELLMDSDTDSFQDVKLVEYPGEDSYVVAFKTAETPDAIAEDTGNGDMVTLFMPMAPNPVMGGFVIHVSRERVVDVDLTVEEGIRSIVTSGVAVGQDEEALAEVSERRLRTLGDLDDLDDLDDHANVTDVEEAPEPDPGGEAVGPDDPATGEDDGPSGTASAAESDAEADQPTGEDSR